MKDINNKIIIETSEKDENVQTKLKQKFSKVCIDKELLEEMWRNDFEHSEIIISNSHFEEWWNLSEEQRHNKNLGLPRKVEFFKFLISMIAAKKDPGKICERYLIRISTWNKYLVSCQKIGLIKLGKKDRRYLDAVSLIPCYKNGVRIDGNQKIVKNSLI